MSIRTDAEVRLSNFVYKYELKQTFGLHAGNYDLFKLMNIRMIMDVLTWDDTADYLTDDERDCLIGKLNYNLRTCNC